MVEQQEPTSKADYKPGTRVVRTIIRTTDDHAPGIKATLLERTQLGDVVDMWLVWREDGKQDEWATNAFRKEDPESVSVQQEQGEETNRALSAEFEQGFLHGRRDWQRCPDPSWKPSGYKTDWEHGWTEGYNSGRVGSMPRGVSLPLIEEPEQNVDRCSWGSLTPNWCPLPRSVDHTHTDLKEHDRYGIMWPNGNSGYSYGPVSEPSKEEEPVKSEDWRLECATHRTDMTAACSSLNRHDECIGKVWRRLKLEHEQMPCACTCHAVSKPSNPDQTENEHMFIGEGDESQCTNCGEYEQSRFIPEFCNGGSDRVPEGEEK